ncbi:hypothetical protein [Streptomyces hainanensis]|uniref:Uncharacterized protein n=1 Tax=Streptomyces hainanensis TaxID=402648 RepID=A0A4R4T762_9ACTN|nr:hypothetical protein [Streptomyces hainanensis]TDC72850.1 hypothetical protein E1283_20715 [Streptomyces hainanensis]
MRKRLGLLSGALVLSLAAAGTATAASPATRAAAASETAQVQPAALVRVYVGYGSIWQCAATGWQYVASGQAVDFDCVGYAPYMAMLYIYVYV